MQQLEEKGMKQVAQSTDSLVNVPKDKQIEHLYQAVIQIMKEGEKEFIKENKRTFTYSELRQLYG
jgi:hypothetical protein